MGIRWFSMNEAMHAVDHEPVDVHQALDVADRCLAQLRPQYESGEEALAATMFGFTREDGSYMQICIHSLNHIDVEYDFPRVFRTFFQRLLARPRSHSESLSSRDALRSRIEMFFAHGSLAMREELAKEVRSR